MKKMAAILLALCLLTLCGCSSGILGKLQMPDSSAPALSVTVDINGKFELILNYAQDILEVKPLDSGSESLLADMGLGGKSFAGGIISVLEKAKEQGLLTEETVISIRTQELAEGTWTVATKDMLLRPVEKFFEQAGMTLHCDFTPAGEIPPELHPEYTEDLGDHIFVSYFTSDGIHYMNATIYDNGEYHVNYIWQRLWVTWWSDVEHTFTWHKDNISYTYRSSANGLFTTQVVPIIIDTYPTLPESTTEPPTVQEPTNIPPVTAPLATEIGGD